MGAIGVLAAGALCAAVLSVASRVPPTPIDTERIPAVEIGSAIEGDVTPAVPRDRRSGSRRRDGTRARDRARHLARRAGGSARPVAYRDSGSGAGQDAVGGPPSAGGPDRPLSGTAPGGGSGGDGPGAQGNHRGGERQPAPGGGGGGDWAQPPDVTAPGGAPAPTQPAGGEEAVGDDPPAPTGTAASEQESEGEMDTDPAPAAAIPEPTLARSDDSGAE